MSLLEDTVGNPRTEFPRSELLHFLQDARDFAPVRGRFPGVRRIVGTPRLGRLAVVAVMAMVLTNFRWNCTPSLWAEEPPHALPCFLSHPNDHDSRSFSSSSALAASARAPAWERLAGPESTPESG